MRRSAFIVPLFTSAILAGHSAFAAAPERAAHFAEALDKAKSTNRDIVVLLHGSDWNPAGEKFRTSIFESPALEKLLGDSYVFTAIDKREKTTPEYELLQKNNSAMTVSAPSLPGVVVFDPQGRLIGRVETVVRMTQPAEFAQQLAPIRQRRVQRDTEWAEAAKLTGPAKAEKLGAGLDAMGQGLGHKDAFKSTLADIKAADPSDSTGYAAKYEFNGRKLLERSLELANKGKRTEAEAEFGKLLAQKRLDADQKQQIQAARFAFYNKLKDSAKAEDALRTIVTLNPNNDLGRGAKKYLEKLKGA